MQFTFVVWFSFLWSVISGWCLEFCEIQGYRFFNDELFVVVAFMGSDWL